MATVPLSGTNIRLLSGVPFGNDYVNTRWFDSIIEQTAYFTGKPLIHNMTQATFQRDNIQTYVKTNASIDSLRSVNYLMFQNAQYNNKWFYAFVTNLEYKNESVTYVHFQIDVFQTWRFDMAFEPSYVVREHRPLWNADGSPVINTRDEGLDYGSVYETMKIENYIPFDDVFFMVIVAKQVMHVGNDLGKTITVNNGSPQPLSFYVVPFKLNGTQPNVTIDGTPQTISSIAVVLNAMYTQTTAVNNVVSIYITEHIGYTPSYTNNTMDFQMSNFAPVNIQQPDTGVNVVALYCESLPNYSSKTTSLGDKYSGYEMPVESKLLMHPYTVTILDDFKGNRVELKNEYIDGQTLAITVRGSLGTSNKVSYAVVNYLTKYITDTNLKNIVSLEHSLINNSSNDVPIITDYLSAYLQGNKNQLENQKNSILFNGAMNAISGASGMIGGAVGGASAGATRGGLGGSIAGGIAGMVGGTGGLIQGIGNTQLQLQSLNAKQKDINNMPPQMTKMGSNTYFDYGNDYAGIYVIKKQITAEHRKKLSDYFNMYGYKTDEVKPPNFHTRQNWNYVHTLNCNIKGNFNNEDINELKAIFDSGVTLWHTDEVGNYGLTNGVL